MVEGDKNTIYSLHSITDVKYTHNTWYNTQHIEEEYGKVPIYYDRLYYYLSTATMLPYSWKIHQYPTIFSDRNCTTDTVTLLIPMNNAGVSFVKPIPSFS